MGILNERLKEKRLECGFTLAEVAAKLSQTEATTQRHESGAIKNVPYEKICAYADLYKTTPEHLMGWGPDFVIPDATEHIHTLAAHHDGNDWTEEETEEIQRFIDYVLSKRGK